VPDTSLTQHSTDFDKVLAESGRGNPARVVFSLLLSEALSKGFEACPYPSSGPAPPNCSLRFEVEPQAIYAKGAGVLVIALLAIQLDHVQ